MKPGAPTRLRAGLKEAVLAGATLRSPLLQGDKVSGGVCHAPFSSGASLSGSSCELHGCPSWSPVQEHTVKWLCVKSGGEAGQGGRAESAL